MNILVCRAKQLIPVHAVYQTFLQASRIRTSSEISVKSEFLICVRGKP